MVTCFVSHGVLWQSGRFQCARAADGPVASPGVKRRFKFTFSSPPPPSCRRASATIRGKSGTSPQNPKSNATSSPSAVQRDGDSLPSIQVARPSLNATTTELTSATVSVDLLTPMMRHWVETKRKYPGYLILYRVGDFFETFFEDSVTFADACDLILTAKDAGKALGARVPMAGIPHYTLDEKCRILVSKAINIAVVDQVESASVTAPGALVRRAVTRLITPGTLLDDDLLDTSKPNYLACVSILSWRSSANRFGVAFVDICTGELLGTECLGFVALEDCLRAKGPAEVLLQVDSKYVDDSLENSPPPSASGTSVSAHSSALVAAVRRAGAVVVTPRPRREFDLTICAASVCERFEVDNVESLGLRERDEIVSAIGAVLGFVSETVEIDGRGKIPLSRPALYSPGDCLQMDQSALRNLEVVETLRSGSTGKSLQWAVDRTVTSMGARRVRSWLLCPSKEITEIMYRQRIVGHLASDAEIRADLTRLLRGFADLERLAGRVGGDRASPRELQRLAQSLISIPAIVQLLKSSSEECREDSPFCAILQVLHPSAEGGSSEKVHCSESMVDVARVILDALVDPAPSNFPSGISASLSNRLGRSGGGHDGESTRVFTDGYCPTLDSLRMSRSNPQQLIAAFEDQEQKRTGISSLRVRRFRNTGYAIRIARSVAERKLSEDMNFFSSLGYERGLSTKTEMRFKCEALSSYERDEFTIGSQIALREAELYSVLLDRVGKLTDVIRAAAAGLAELDALLGFASVASERSYVAPVMVDFPSRELTILDGRHPVVEQTLGVGRTFVPNSVRMGISEDNTSRVVASDIPPCDEMILCGPNASGKSCAMRQVGLIVVLAQVGCFVPASYARLAITDRIFTRVGAVDDVSRGQSTFQVEMAETAAILSQATPSSLVLLDEIGRGTAVADGIAIAWSVAEHMAGEFTLGLDGERGHEIGGMVTGSPRTIFVTHYHELNELAVLPNVEPFRMQTIQRASVDTAGENDRELIYTHRIVVGPSFESHGIAIARRAGFPPSVIARAEQVLETLRLPAKNLVMHLRSCFSAGNSRSLDVRHAPSGSVRPADDLFSEGYKAGLIEGRRLAIDEAFRALQALQKDE